MDDEDKLTQTVEQFAELAAQDKNVDVATLMMSALDKSTENKVSGKARKWAYAVSLFFPPFGLLFAAKYYFYDGHADAKEVAWVSVLLTSISILGFVILMKVLFSVTGASVTQIEQTKPSDIMQLTQ
jgi:hypothetical protein